VIGKYPFISKPLYVAGKKIELDSEVVKHVHIFPCRDFSGVIRHILATAWSQFKND